MTKKITFYIGLNDRETYLQAMPTIAASHLIENILLAHNCSGATLTDGRGAYEHKDGTKITENSIIVQVFEFGAPIAIKEICDALKIALNQESIAVEIQETNSELY